MSWTADDIAQQAAATGFAAETLEKVFTLLDLLEGIRRHPFLQTRVALKGGTALNLFTFDVPRLSVDIDLNYIGATGRDAMLADVPKVKQAVQAVCGRAGVVVKRIPKDHAGGKWRLGYNRAAGGTAALELDVNFMLRTPLWNASRRNSYKIGGSAASGVLVLDDHELAAGKLAAMMARAADRDLFDARALLLRNDFELTKLRLGFVIYGAMNRKDWRTVKVEDINLEHRDVERSLVPMLRADVAPTKADIPTWTAGLVAECRHLMAKLLPLADNERAFLDQLNDHGEIRPDLLAADVALQENIRAHPQLAWKALNVKAHRQAHK